MAKLDIAALAADSLAGGEELLGGVRVNWNGMVPPVQASTNTVLGEPEVPDPDKLVAFPRAKQLALVLTGGRILVWSLGFSGKPKSALGEVPLSAVTEVHTGETRYGELMRITLKSGAIVDLEVMRGEDGQGFIGNLQHLVESDRR